MAESGRTTLSGAVVCIPQAAPIVFSVGSATPVSKVPDRSSIFGMFVSLLLILDIQFSFYLLLTTTHYMSANVRISISEH